MNKKIRSSIIAGIIMITATIILLMFLNNYNKDDGKMYSSTSYSDTAFYFDTFISITINDNDISDASKKEIINDIFDLCGEYEKVFSTTLKGSELEVLNSSDKNTATLSDELFDILNQAFIYKEMTNGCFCPEIGAISALWDFKEASIPDENIIKEHLNEISNYTIILDGKDVKYNGTGKKPSITLGGIAKGYIADKIKENLISKNVKNAIINLGGNVLLLDDSSKKVSVGIAKPFSENGEYIAVIKTNNNSVVTSGIYERYFTKDKEIYHHLIDPKTGYPAKNKLYSVTIVCDSSTMADALSTSVFVMGLDKGMDFINSKDDVEAIFIDNNNNIHVSDGLILNGEMIEYK